MCEFSSFQSPLGSKEPPWCLQASQALCADTDLPLLVSCHVAQAALVLNGLTCPADTGGRPHEHPCLCCRSRVLTEIRPGIDRVSCSFWQLPLKDASSKSIRNHVAGVSSSSLLNLTVTTLGIGLNLRWEGYITSGCMTGVSSGHSHYLNKSESHFESFMAQLV